MKLFDLQGRLLQNVYLIVPHSDGYFDVWCKHRGQVPTPFLSRMGADTLSVAFKGTSKAMVWL
jgi:hypothetical protein